MGQVGNRMLEWVSSCLSFHWGACKLAIKRPTIPYVECHEPAPWLLNIWVKRRLETTFLWRELWSCSELSPPFGRNSDEYCLVTPRLEGIIKRTNQRALNSTYYSWRTWRPMPKSSLSNLEWSTHWGLIHPKKSGRQGRGRLANCVGGRMGRLMLGNWPAFPVFVRAWDMWVFPRVQIWTLQRREPRSKRFESSPVW